MAGSAALLAAAPMPAYAGGEPVRFKRVPEGREESLGGVFRGMFDFGLTLPFVAVSFLTLMAVPWTPRRLFESCRFDKKLRC